MADQTSVNGGRLGGRVRINSPLTEGVLGNLAELGGDVAGLAELQAQLAVADLKISAAKAAIPAALVGAGVVLLLSAVPVALIGTSELIADALNLSHRGWAYLIVAGVALVLTVILVLIGLPRIGKSFDALSRSKDEFARNLSWIKTVVANSGRLPATRRR